MRRPWRVLVAGLAAGVCLLWAATFATVDALDAAPDVRVEAHSGLETAGADLCAPAPPVVKEWVEHGGLGPYRASLTRPKEWGS